MQYFQYLLQLIVGLGILNVWLLRFNRPTSYRGGNASSMKDEFAHYGLPTWSVGVVGFLKIGSALGLIVGIFLAALVIPSAGVMAFLMVGALVMHIKVSDPFIKSVPAFCMLLLSVGIIFLAS